eukprot:12737389-Alexandrium_andersonii.AAC.1
MGPPKPLRRIHCRHSDTEATAASALEGSGGRHSDTEATAASAVEGSDPSGLVLHEVVELGPVKLGHLLVEVALVLHDALPPLLPPVSG